MLMIMNYKCKSQNARVYLLENIFAFYQSFNDNLKVDEFMLLIWSRN
jgi:hypothetical protein